ncbi:hypothetical protein TRP8649_03786 [Pelagimonas phthalicica]|uniref:Uncharacterized protein n=2 Tax=Pelagimonas phthalicica TaxID=1037362 RepID=A0A238JG40_9RHOB|nr:hypothetical protein CLV87_4367 [Pelagimonas phthalicica]SMX29648.1 hypothetical protein TRP8649_03786 [Pelagimonas phthalicica]
MVKDRYGKTIFPENSITVFDTSLDYDSELFEDTVGLKLRDFDRDRYSSAYEADFGSGADWPAVAYEFLNSLVPFSAVAAAFFYGDRIEKSALAWKRMAASLLSCIPRQGYTDANGAALLALNEVFELSKSSDVRLLAYTWVDEEAMFFDEPDKAKAVFETIAKLDKIESREKQFGVGLHSAPTFLFKFETDNGQVLAAVRQDKVHLIEM